MKKEKSTIKKIKEAVYEVFEYEKDRIDLVKIIWFDAHTSKDTLSFQDIRNNGLITAMTIGYLIHENDELIAICGFLFPDPHHDIQDPTGQTAFREVHFIPKKMIKSIISLKIDFEESKKWKKQ